MDNTCGTSYCIAIHRYVYWLPYIYNRKRMKQQQTSGLLLGVFFLATLSINHCKYIKKQHGATAAKTRR